MDFRRPLRIVTPTLDADVLEVLAHADAEMSGREIQRLAGHGSPQGIRNAADRLTEQGIVVRRRAGGAHLYKLNRDHLAARPIEELADMPSLLTRRLRTMIEANWKTRPVAVVLFGSAATGRATEGSDLDLLVVRPAGCDPDAAPWQTQLAQLEEQARQWSGNDARIVEYGEEELVAGRPDELVLEALEEGISLCGEQQALLRQARGPR